MCDLGQGCDQTMVTQLVNEKGRFGIQGLGAAVDLGKARGQSNCGDQENDASVTCHSFWDSEGADNSSGLSTRCSSEGKYFGSILRVQPL